MFKEGRDREREREREKGERGREKGTNTLKIKNCFMQCVQLL